MNHSRLKNLPISFKISALALLTIMSISLFANLFIKTKALEQNTKFYQASAEQCLDSIVNDLTSGNVAGAYAGRPA